MKFLRDPIFRRLAPLYIMSFTSGLMFWYAIEKVFMTKLGFTASDITTAAIIVSVAILLSEVPAGIIADRWSRKGVLFFAMLTLALASVFLGSAHTIAQYMVFITLVGLYFALESGIPESIIYDTLLEQNGSRQGYEKYYGQTQAVNSIALIIGSLAGGVIGAKFGLQTAYFVSVPVAVLAMVSVLMLKEPLLHKQHETTFLLSHLRETFQHVLRKGTPGWILLALIAFGILDSFLLDIDQLWPLALTLPVVWYGPLNALLLSGYGLGGPLADRIAKYNWVGTLVCGFGLVCTLSLSVRNIYVIAAAQFGFITCFSALLIIAEGRLQDVVPSRLRTSALSVASSLTTLCFVPVAFAFGLATESFSVFRASYLLLPITAAGIIGYLVFRRRVLVKP